MSDGRGDAGLQVSDLSVRFGGHLAVGGVSLKVDPGRICGLIGPNGAGKTTTFNAICGVINPTSGKVLLDGRDISRLPTHKRARAGIGRTFQRLEVFSSLTVRDNVRTGLEIRKGWSRGRHPAPAFLASDDDLSSADEIELILDRLHLAPLADLPVGALPTGQARLVELGRALAARPRVLLLDEPASGLDERESIDFGDLLVDLAGAGLGILLVEHDIALVMRVCEELSVLDFGQVIARGTPEEVRANEAVLAAYLGSATGDEDLAHAAATELPGRSNGHGGGGRDAVGDLMTVETHDPDEPLLELRGVRAAYGTIEVLHGIDLKVLPGQVVALLGPNGSGKTTTLAVASGQLPPTSGQLMVAGRDVTGVSPEDLARRGLTTIPEGKGIFPNLTVRENLIMATYAGVSIAHVEEVAYAQFPRLSERRSQVAGTMSGGEQQMLAMARGLAVEPAVLLLDELSMGLAPLVVEELYGIVSEIARAGTSILVVEQFARTVLGVADVAAIMVNGTIRQVGRPDEVERELSSAYLGG